MTARAVPRLGLGCATLGNLFRERTDDEAHAVLDAAWDAGIRHFDTAPHYGLGLSEQRLGRFLATKPREEFVLSTKVGRLLRPNPACDGTAQDAQGYAVPARLRREWDVSLGGVRASVEESLTRLGLDRVDILHLHDPEHSGIEAAVQRGMESLAALRAEGTAALIGIGSASRDALLTAVGTGLADIVMVAGRYTLLDQTVAPDVLAACDEHGTRIVAAAVFNSGLLAEAPKLGAMYDYAPVPSEVLQRAVRIAEVCAAHGVELPTAALHYPLLDSHVQSVVVGAASPSHVLQNVARLAQAVPDQLWADLEEQGLVPRCG